MVIIKFPFRAISKDNEKIFNKYGRFFLSKKYKEFEASIREIASLCYKGNPLQDKVTVHICCHFTNKVHCDAYNLPKGIMDALQGILFKNDKQVRIGIVEVVEGALQDSFTVSIQEEYKGGEQNG